MQGYSPWLKKVWPQYNWDYDHLVHIRKKLREVTYGRCKRLILSTAPQHGKSSVLTIPYPVWRLLRDPTARIAVAGYNQTHANRFSRQARKLALESGLSLSDDRQAANEWETTQGGRYLAVGVGGGITGTAVDFLIIDDPIKGREEADSEAYRERVWEWYQDDLLTRLSKGAPIVIIATRWHEADLIGKILASPDGANWENVKLPAIAEENDPIQRAVGAALCEDLHPLSELHSIREIQGEGFTGLYQQNPVPRGGLFFRREWFGDPIDDVPVGAAQRVRYFDTAASLKSSACFTAGVLMSKIGTTFYIEDVIRGRWQPADRNDIIKQSAHADKGIPGFIKTYFEHGAGDSGLESAQRLIALMAGLPVEADRVTGSKEERATPFADQARAGNVKILARPWTSALLNELASFPRGAFMDQVDSCSGAFNRLTSQRPTYSLIARQR